VNAASTVQPRLSQAINRPALPPALQQNLERHRQNLRALSDSLRGAGLDERTVANSLDTMIRSYRAELAMTFEDLLKEEHR